ncbi:hypothetical protein GCM10009864_22790 [Streptomyces lunalinharesii]|uniref:DUF3631 domain-containing protein n=1 Tax=Streptomyces lunalinharesii TaxID=333384 RepID=A0ABN3RRP4_9ACTN
MEDSTSTTTENTSPTIWPIARVPGQGIPWRRENQADAPSPVAKAVEPSADEAARGDRRAADTAAGDRPREVPESRSPQATAPLSPPAGNTQASGVEMGTGPQDAHVAPGDRNGDRAAHTLLGTDGPVHPHVTVPDDGSGTGDREGAEAVAAGDGVVLLDELRAAIGKYVVLPSQEALTAVTLWVAATHIQTALQHAPRLAVISATKGCGKSRVLDVLYETVHDPMMTVNTSPAVIFRTIGKIPPTLLVDEADTIFGPKASGDSEILRGLLNAGHQRNRPAWRISGPEHKPTPFPTFAMAAIAGIGDLPDTITDRSVVLRIQKRKPSEKVAPFRSRYAAPELNALRGRLAAWLGPLRSTAARMVPQMPVEDRAADTWEPLVIIADLAGGHWPAQARAACVAMTRFEAVQDEQTNVKVRLLRDIHRIFERAHNPEALSSQDLVAALIQDADAPWAEHGNKGLNAHHLGFLLRDFDIHPANYRFAGGRQAKAYIRNRFLDPWARHCPHLTEATPEPTHSGAPARSAQGKPPAAPAGSLPVGPPGGPAGPKRTL